MLGKGLLDILIIEDNSGDIVLTREAFEEVGLTERVHIAKDGEDALRFLYHQPPFENAPVPDIILLDLNLPKKDGREILHEIKNDEKLKVIPVIILTTSKSEKDILSCYRSYANCYIEKPVDFDEYIKIIEMIKDFWLNLVRLPGEKKN
ncbi:MAG: response regulator [Chitinophagales bacterium]